MIKIQLIIRVLKFIKCTDTKKHIIANFWKTFPLYYNYKTKLIIIMTIIINK